jgi:signal transduction histidine kinase
MNRRDLAAGILLGAAGFAVNWFKVPLFYNVDFLFGSIFSMFAMLRFGFGAGFIAAVIAALCTWFHWYHPWAIVILVCEALCAGWLMKRKRTQLLVGDIIYWFTGGLLLIWLFYHLIMGFSVGSTLLVALKQGINGLVNTLTAEALFLFSWRFSASKEPPSLRQRLQIIMQGVVLVPAFILAFADIRGELHEQLSLLQQHTGRLAGVGKLTIENWLTGESNKVSTIANLIGDSNRKSPQEIQSLLEKVHSANTEIYRIGYMNGSHVTRAFSPSRDELGVSTIGISLSDRHYIANLKKTLRPTVYDTFIGKIGKPGPRMIILAPIREGGEYQGAAFIVSLLDYPANLLRTIVGDRQISLTLLDGENRVVASTRTDREFHEHYALPPGGIVSPMGQGVSQWVPNPEHGVGPMKRWNRSFLLTDMEVSSETGFRLVVESSLSPLLKEISTRSSILLGLLAGMTLLVIALSRYFSRHLLAPIVELEKITSQLPARIAGGEEIIWPAAKIKEELKLRANFQMMENALQQSFMELTVINENLETRVSERTAELEVAHIELESKKLQLVQLNTSLQQRVDASVTELREKDQMLISQSRQAAMGEMIGNIAHQWRQPLNALSMLVANIQAAFQYNELDGAYLEKSSATANRLIQKMSSTIDDFRNFFRPDKTIVLFSPLEQINHAVSLMEGAFASHNISINLDALQDFIITGYPNEYSQVILNLLTNAKDAIIESGSAMAGDISITLYERNGHGCVSVRDNGGGIPADVKDRIFEPYFSTKNMGTGIGLYMSKMIIERNMNGKIEVNNRDNGAEFIVVTPIEGREK